jgi:integrase
MSADDLLLRVECYVAVRRALGYAVRSEEKLLKDFVQFLELNGASGPIRAQTAIEWACAPAPGRGPSGEASRLKVVRRFLSHLQAFEFETEVPGPGVLPAFRRPLPYLYSADEIATLMKEASHLGPKDSLRPYTYVALIGLLASSGLRVGEALRLKMEEVRLSCSHPHVQVVQTKFRKSRLVPLHPSSAEKIAKALGRRDHPVPRVINTDGHNAYPPAIVPLKAAALIAHYIEGIFEARILRGHVAARCRDPKDSDNRRSRAAFVTRAFVHHA